MRFDIKALANRINERRIEYDRLHPDAPLSITTSLSRILEHADDYIPYRRRAARKQRRPPANPSIGTIVEIAAMLGTTVGDLLGERSYRVTTGDRRKIRAFVRWLTTTFDLNAPELDERATSLVDVAKRAAR